MSKSAREVALKILNEIDIKDAYSNISINRNIDKSLSTLDENFIREIVYGVLENKIYIDYVINKFSKVRMKKISPIILNILRMGVYQILFLEKIPNSAIVNEAVNLTKKHSHKGTQGFVNGLLRGIIRNENNIGLPDKSEDPVSYVSIKYSHPKWMVERWVKEYGLSFTEDLCIANNEKPLLNVRVNTLKTDKKSLMSKLSEYGYKVKESSYASDGIIIEKSSRITEIPEFKDGLFQIQDESSMLVAQIMNPRENSLVVDVCSAPGGKATHIAQVMKNKGKIISRDVYDHKLGLINNNSKRLGINIVKTEKYNALEIDEDLINKADYCLVDAPCSGLGLIRRKPDIKWNKEEDNLSEITDLQLNILENASRYLKNGGTLIYSTCTIEKEENINLISKFLSMNNGFKLVGFEDRVIEHDNLSTASEGFIELFPNIHGTDGFFIAKMSKI